MEANKSNNRGTLNEWLEQYQAELEKQASDRSARVESLLIIGDFQKIRELLEAWEKEDKKPNSVRQEYNKISQEMKTNE